MSNASNWIEVGMAFPSTIPAGVTFTVPTNYQSLSGMPIHVAGFLRVQGFYINVKGLL